MYNVNLELVDPIKFEELCQHILGDYYNVRVDRTPPTNDEGKDLIVYFPDGKMYVECKHYLNSSVGRPIIQKLQGAMVTDSVSKGMIINTGRYSKDAVEYVSTNNLPIKLVDLQELIDIGQKCGYLLKVGSDNRCSYCTKPKTQNELTGDIKKILTDSLESKPKTIGEILNLTKRKTVMIPFYKITYDINATFRNSTGIIHQEIDSGGFYIRDSSKKIEGEIFTKDMENMRVEVFDPLTIGCPIEKNTKSLESDIKDIALRKITTDYTKEISYRGNNNQRYSKTCVPSKNDITIKSIDYIYIPCTLAEYILGSRARSIGLAENNGNGIHVFEDYGLKCEYCSTKHSKLMLCNDCWSIIGEVHSRYCSECGKVTCTKCSSYYTKWLFFKKPVCRECLPKISDKKMKKWKVI